MTEFVRSHSDNHLLLRELAHRVNNEFTSIINAISRAAARSPNPESKTVLNEAVEMLHDYVDVHRALKMPKPDTQVNAAEYLDHLCRVMSRSKLEQAGIDLVFDSAPVTLGSERSWYLGLIVYELVTNAARHSLMASSPLTRSAKSRAPWWRKAISRKEAIRGTQESFCLVHG